ncbi:MAG: hypothetical protein AB1797_04990 [bacterium]
MLDARCSILDTRYWNNGFFTSIEYRRSRIEHPASRIEHRVSSIEDQGGNTMDSKLAELQDSFIEIAGQMSSSLGLNRVVGQLYGLLFLSKEPLSLDQMSDRLKMSKGNISVNIRELEKWGAVRKVWTKGSRKDFYEADLDTFKIIINQLTIGLKRRLSEVLVSLEGIEECLPNPGGSEATLFKDRLMKAKEMSRRIEGLLTVGKSIFSANADQPSQKLQAFRKVGKRLVETINNIQEK